METDLEHRPLGNTGLCVSALGFGASPLGGVFGPVGQAEADRAVRAALDLGISFFDSAPYYGATLAESVLGRALQGIPRDRYVLATKVGRYGKADFDFTPSRVIASVDESLARLRTDHIDLIQCHDIEYVPLGPVIHETLPALERLKESGKVRFIGITGYPLSIFRRVLAVRPVDTVLSYCHYTLANRQLAALLPELQSRSVGVISAAPLAMGLLTEPGPPAWHPAPEALKDACRKAAAHCTARGADLTDLALAFALRPPEIAVTLVGMAGEEQVRRNVAAASVPVDEVLLAEVEAILAPVRDLEWETGLPENA